MRTRLSMAALAFVLALLAPAAGALAGEEKGEGKKDKNTFVPVETLTATVIAANGRRAVMTVQSGIDAPDPALHAYVDSVTPRLRDAFVQVLQAYAGGLPAGAPPDPEYLGRRLQEATDRVVGRKGARFLFGGIMVN